MKKWVGILLLLLSGSVALNLYLLSRTHKYYLFAHSKIEPSQPQINVSEPLLSSTYTDKPVDEANQASQATDSDIPSGDAIISQSNTSRDKLLTQANLWLQERNLLALGVFLQNYLKQYPQDMDFLLIEAKLKVETTLLSDAIAYYYDLLRNSMTAAQKHEVEQQIQTLSTTTIEQLKRLYSWDILAMFVEPLLQLEPNNRLYILSLARAYAELFQQGLMENILASLDFNDPDAQSIRQIIIAQQQTAITNKKDNEQTADTHAQPEHAIPLQQYGDQYVVEATLSGNQVSLLIDTGASITAISNQYFDKLSNRYKINYQGRFNIGTAGGSIMAPIYQFRELTINHVTVQNLPVVVLPMQGIKYADGLLGMNFLREFDFKIDQRQVVMFIQ